MATEIRDGKLLVGDGSAGGTTGQENRYWVQIKMGTAPGYGLTISNGAIDPWFHVNSNGVGFVGDGTTIPFWSIEDEPNFVRELRAQVVPAGGYSYLWAKSTDDAGKPNDLQLWANRNVVVQAGRTNNATDNSAAVILQGSAGVLVQNFGNSAGTFLQFRESAAPAAPAADHARLFTQDNSNGKTQLCVRFATGAVQVIATEP